MQYLWENSYGDFHLYSSLHHSILNNVSYLKGRCNSNSSSRWVASSQDESGTICPNKESISPSWCILFNENGYIDHLVVLQSHIFFWKLIFMEFELNVVLSRRWGVFLVMDAGPLSQFYFYLWFCHNYLVHVLGPRLPCELSYFVRNIYLYYTMTKTQWMSDKSCCEACYLAIGNNCVSLLIVYSLVFETPNGRMWSMSVF